LPALPLLDRRRLSLRHPRFTARRHLVLPALAVGLLGVVPALATSADEDAVAKSVEAFRLAQIVVATLVTLAPSNAQWKKDLAWFDGEIARLDESAR